MNAKVACEWRLDRRGDGDRFLTTVACQIFARSPIDRLWLLVGQSIAEEFKAGAANGSVTTIHDGGLQFGRGVGLSVVAIWKRR